MKTLTPADVADYIEEHGQARGTYGEETGAVCLVGAARVLVYGTAYPAEYDYRGGRGEVQETSRRAQGDHARKVVACLP